MNPLAQETERGSRLLEVRNPYDGTVVGSVPMAEAADVEEALERADALTPRSSSHERARILGAAAERVEEEREAFVVSIVRESGLARKDAEREVTRAVGVLTQATAEILAARGEAMLTDVTAAATSHLGVALYEPIGVVVAITPFNRPLNQVVVKLAPALAVGNQVVLKPSEQTPLTALAFADVLADCGLEPGLVQTIVGDPDEVGEPLIASPLVDMVTFTGSAAVGHRIARRIGMVKALFELGDSGALIVMPGADIDEAARVAATGAFATAGQSCRGVKRILAHTDVADELVERLAEHARKLRVGDPMDPATDIGTLIDEEAAIRVEARVREAVEAGAREVLGAERAGAQLGPIVLDGVPRDCPLVAEETFGPVAPVIRVDDLRDAIDCANGTGFGLQAGIFTPDWDEAWRAASALQVGGVVVNGGPQFDAPNIPFGGVKGSGLGREGVRFAMEEMSVRKTLVLARPGP
jgi:acyl-CoA reductase-like NAD-dependent aldehyde dehydrogenase